MCGQVKLCLFCRSTEELQPGQMNSYTTFDWLNSGALSLVLVKKQFCGLLFYSDVNIRVD